MSEEALRRIAECKRTRGKRLNLSRCGIRGPLPLELTELEWLEELHIIGKVFEPYFEYSELISKNDPDSVGGLMAIGYLKNLRVLDLSGTEANGFEVIEKLEQLQVLRLSRTQIENLQPLQSLTKLLELSLDETKVHDLGPLAQLFLLEKLSLTKTEVTELGPLTGLKNLKYLCLHHTKVAQLTPLSGHKEMVWLGLSGTQVADLDALSRMEQLETLWLHHTRISNLRPLASLRRLETLGIKETLVLDISPLTGLANLTNLRLGYTGVSDLEPIRRQLASGIQIGFEQCPILNPPLEIAQQGNQAILRYWDRLEAGTLPLNEAKIILLGQGAAGKTSLVKRLFKERFKKTESQTNGVLIRKQSQMLGDECVTLRYWDFGGQEIMHATHRFFLSQRSLYLVVLDARKDEGDVDYWLDHVKTYGGRSRVIVVVNKIDENPGFQLDERGLQHKYGDRIQGFHRISCKSGEGIKELQKHIHALVAADELTQQPFPKPWRELKDKVEAIETDFISYERFRERCEEQTIHEHAEQEILLRLLNDLGVALHFESLRRYNTSVLNPEWLTLAVYRVLNSRRIADQGGEFEAEDMEKYLNDPKYSDKLDPKRFPREKYEFIAEAMEAFQLCYRLPERHRGRTRYLIPELLPKQEPELDPLPEGAVQMEVRYPGLLPPSILPRFIVAMHPWVVAGKAWRTGVLLLHGDWETQALVKLDKQDRRIRIAVAGKQARRMMGFVRDTLGKLHSEFADLAVEEWVPLDGGRDFVKYAHLVGLEKMGKKEYSAAELMRDFPIADLLDGVEPKERRQEHRPDPVRIFISYAHKNLQADGAIHKENLLTHLSSYTHSGEVVVWQDGCIVAGQEWEKEIWTQHRQADIVLCLVNANFIASEYCLKREFLEADNGRKRGEKDVVPILVEECHFQPVRALSGLQFANIIAVAEHSNANSAWAEVTRALAPVIEGWKARKVEEDRRRRYGRFGIGALKGI